ncbi:MAG: hypothetical protein HY896_04400 [Deltaproteobacteria bacterium]|nr:hypothetical protein [Deltaproteobacteria bacterium]
MKRMLMAFLAACFLAGCSSGFVYQRKANPSGDVPKLPVKVAVVAFRNGTVDNTSAGNIVTGHVFNLARTDINGLWLNTGAAFSVSSLPPEKWAKSLAEDMAASGAFRSVKFLYSLSEVTDEDIVVEGALTKSDFTTIKDKPDEFALHLKVLRMPGNAVVREADVGRSGIRPRNLTSGCFSYGGCVVDRIHGYLNGVMQAIFTDIRLDLVRVLSPPPEKKPGPPAKESPEEVVKRILGKQ